MGARDVVRGEGHLALRRHRRRRAVDLFRDDRLGSCRPRPVADIDYQQSLLAVVGATIVLAIVGMIVIGIGSPEDAAKADQRDKDINRLGEYVGGIVLAIGMIVPFGLATG